MKSLHHITTKMYRIGLILTAITVFLAACAPLNIIIKNGGANTATLIFYDWENDIPQAVFLDFEEEFGIEVIYKTYDSQEDAVENMKAGQVYDVVVLDNDAITPVAENGFLAAIDYSNVPNFKNISPNFRDLAYDPKNLYSIPYSWGSIGLVVFSERLETMPTRWADIWNDEYAGKIGVREDVPYDFIGVTLKSLGYPINSEDPAQLEEALQRMLAVKENLVLVGSTAEDALPLMLNGDIDILIGWAEDVWALEEHTDSVVYILPEEGTLLWGDSFVIPANSPNKETAEIFINYLLRPEVSAQIVNENYYASANEAALEFIDPEIKESTLIYPTNDDLKNAEIFLPHNEEADRQYIELWQKFLAHGLD